MAEPSSLSRKEALAVLRRHGIHGPHVYLIDLIPLVEMIWADGKAQESEVEIFEGYLERHVGSINTLAGHTVLTSATAREFVVRFLRERPDPDLLRSLRSLVAAVRLSSSDAEHNERLRSSLLATCVDIAASAVTHYPYLHGDRFDAGEKQSFFEILDSVEPGSD